MTWITRIAHTFRAWLTKLLKRPAVKTAPSVPSKLPTMAQTIAQARTLKNPPRPPSMASQRAIARYRMAVWRQSLKEARA